MRLKSPGSTPPAVNRGAQWLIAAASLLSAMPPLMHTFAGPSRRQKTGH
jgi:hypothetical protein